MSIFSGASQFRLVQFANAVRPFSDLLRTIAVARSSFDASIQVPSISCAHNRCRSLSTIVVSCRDLLRVQSGRGALHRAPHRHDALHDLVHRRRPRRPLRHAVRPPPPSATRARAAHRARLSAPTDSKMLCRARRHPSRSRRTEEGRLHRNA